MKYFLLFILISSNIPNLFSMQNTASLNTQAKITSIETKISGRNTYDIASIDYVTEKGDTLSSQIQLYGFPFLGSFKKVGDTVEITYQRDNPYLVQTVSRGILQKYAWHILIAIVLLFFGYRFIKK